MIDFGNERTGIVLESHLANDNGKVILNKYRAPCRSMLTITRYFHEEILYRILWFLRTRYYLINSQTKIY